MGPQARCLCFIKKENFIAPYSAFGSPIGLASSYAKTTCTQKLGYLVKAEKKYTRGASAKYLASAAQMIFKTFLLGETALS